MKKINLLWELIQLVDNYFFVIVLRAIKRFGYNHLDINQMDTRAIQIICTEVTPFYLLFFQ